VNSIGLMSHIGRRRTFVLGFVVRWTLLKRLFGNGRWTCATRTEHVPPGLLNKPHIDHVLLPESWEKGARVVEAWPATVGGVRLSDHSGVVVEVIGEAEGLIRGKGGEAAST
jgi:hypothetical protein